MEALLRIAREPGPLSEFYLGMSERTGGKIVPRCAQLNRRATLAQLSTQRLTTLSFPDHQMKLRASEHGNRRPL